MKVCLVMDLTEARFPLQNHQQQQPVANSWDYNQQQPMQQHQMQQMYPHQPQAQPNDWYYDPNIQQPHAMYNNSYNNYKTDYNCLNNQQPAPIHPTDPSLYNGANYYYPQNPPDAYAAPPQQHQMNHHPQMDYQHSNYHQNYHSSM
jgi:hypothetical protein